MGEHLKKRRMDLGLLQKELAKRLGADTASVWNWENGNANPELKFIPGIITFLGYDPRPKPAVLAKQLVHYREGKGWSQKRYAKELGVDPSTLARWERGERVPRRKLEAMVGR